MDGSNQEQNKWEAFIKTSPKFNNIRRPFTTPDIN